jgi:hypothetical protein
LTIRFSAAKSEGFAAPVAERHRSMTPAERWLAASSMFQTARRIVAASLPNGLTLEQRRLAVVRRLPKREFVRAELTPLDSRNEID